MTKRRGTVDNAIKKGLSKRGAPHRRAERIYRLLLADGPLSTKEIMERLDMTWSEICGSSGGAMQHLTADGRVFTIHGQGNNLMYYAEEEPGESATDHGVG